MMTKKYLDELTYEVVGGAIEVHKSLGPGLLKGIYNDCLHYELSLRKINFVSKVNVPVVFKERTFNVNLNSDFLIENCIVLEVRSVDSLLPVHQAKLFTFMKLLKFPKGILINFNCVNIFKNGQKTYVNEIFRNLPNE
ncbi:MAG: GxxExxY protein [bacterium]